MYREDLKILSKEGLIELIEDRVVKSGEFFFNNPVTTFVANSLYEFDVPVLITDNNIEDPKILYSNIGFQKVTGYTKQELIGKSPKILQGPETEREILDNLKNHLNNDAHFRGSTANYKKDGTIFYNQWGIEPIRNSKGEITHYMSMHTDVTELRFKEIELQKQIDLKNSFFSIISHDLRNPLTGFLTLTKMLKENAGEFSFNKLIKFIEQLNDAAKNLNELLSNLLIWSRSQTSSFEINKLKFFAKDKIENIINLYTTQIDSKNITINLDVKGDLIVNSDPFIFDTILRNLINNAVKFSYQDSQINISAQKDDSFTKIKVIDFGVGIKQENINNLFDIGKKITTTGTNKEKGTGLGLKLCKELANKQNGDILVESELGQGSTFTIIFKN